MGRSLSQLDTSSVAGKITSIVAARHEAALAHEDEATAAQFDVGLDTIYFAALLLMIVNGSGETRNQAEVLKALDTTVEVIAELRRWIEESGS